MIAGLAQPVEQLICNQKVTGSIPVSGTTPKPPKGAPFRGLFLGDMIMTDSLTNSIKTFGDMEATVRRLTGK